MGGTSLFWLPVCCPPCVSFASLSLRPSPGGHSPCPAGRRNRRGNISGGAERSAVQRYANVSYYNLCASVDPRGPASWLTSGRRRQLTGAELYNGMTQLER